MVRNSSSTRALQYTGYYSFVLLGWQTVVLPSLIRPIEIGFHQSDAAFGILYLVKSLLYATGAFAGGFLTERFGRRTVLSSAAALTSASLIVAAISPAWAPFVVGASVASTGGAIIDGGVNGLFLDLFREARGGALNFLHLFFSVGALVAPFPIGLLLGAGVSWRPILLISGIAAALLVVPLLAYRMPSGMRTNDAVESVEVTGPAERSMIPFVALAAAIGLYVAAEIGVSSWVVRFLSDQPVALATGALSIFWLGLALGRLLSRWGAEILEYTTFTVACVLLASISLAAAVLVPSVIVSLILFGLTGLFSGPIYPMIMAIGGQVYPHRLAALSGGLTAGAAIGGIVYPPLMGFMAANVGLRTGMIGAALLGVPAAACLLMARTSAANRAARIAGETAA